MVDEGDIYIGKAQESLAGAESEFAAGRFDNVANRAYYTCFQAAIAALLQAGVRPAGGRSEWAHAFAQAEFAGKLVRRRKRYPARLGDVLGQNFIARQRGDYHPVQVSQTQAARALARAREFLDAIMNGRG